jgi:hypothetical protein
VCIHDNDPPELVAALKALFPDGVVVLPTELWRIPSLTSKSHPDCLQIAAADDPQARSGSVVGVEVKVQYVTRTYWFRRSDSVWVDISAQEAGVTDTTWVE